MDRRERAPDAEETLRIAFDGMQPRIWTALPGIVQKVGKMTVDVQPTINGVKQEPDGSTSSVQMPLLLDCPVLWQGGGGVTATFPIAKGDECLVIIASRCIDGWYANGGVQDAPELRMHNLSDGFALVGVRSAPRAFDAVTDAARLTSDDGATYYELNPTAKTFKVVATGGVTINGVTIDSNGNVGCPATVTASTDVVGGGKSLKSHTHSGVQTGGGTSGPPT